MQNAEKSVLERMIEPKDPNAIPYIYCRRNCNHPADRWGHFWDHELTDYGWQGLRKIMKNGKVAFEMDDSFVLMISKDGTCAIPNTEKNRERLKMMDSLPKVRSTKVSRDHLNKEKRETIWIDQAPQYEEIDNSIVEGKTIDRLMEKIDLDKLSDMIEARKDKKTKKKASKPELLQHDNK